MTALKQQFTLRHLARDVRTCISLALWLVLHDNESSRCMSFHFFRKHLSSFESRHWLTVSCLMTSLPLAMAAASRMSLIRVARWLELFLMVLM